MRFRKNLWQTRFDFLVFSSFSQIDSFAYSSSLFCRLDKRNKNFIVILMIFLQSLIIQEIFFKVVNCVVDIAININELPRPKKMFLLYTKFLNKQKWSIDIWDKIHNFIINKLWRIVQIKAVNKKCIHLITKDEE